MRDASLLLPALLCLLVFGLLRLGDGGAGRETELELHRRGVALLYRRDFAAAERVLTRLVARAGEEHVPWVNLGIAQLNQAELGVDRALVSLERARELAPGEPRISYCIGLIHRFLGRSDMALEEFDEAVRRAPEDPDVHYQLALILLKRDQEDRALGHLEAAKELDPSILGVWQNLFQLYSRSGRERDAARARERFDVLKTTGRGASRGLRFHEMGRLADPIDDWVPLAESVRPAAPIGFASWQEIPGARGPFTLVDHDLDCVAELWCGGERAGIWDLRDPRAPRYVESLEALGDAVAFAVADCDEDGRADIVKATSAGVALLRCSGDGLGFPVAEWIADADGFDTAPETVRLFDVDLEGDLDVAIAGSGRSPAIAINEGRRFGSFAAPPTLKVPSGARLLLVRDLDRDGDTDLLFSTPDGAVIHVDNDPQWRLRPDTTRLAQLGVTEAIVAGDLDGDTDEDLVVAGVAPGVYWNDGRGRFSAQPLVLPDLVGARCLHVLDVDLDGRLDVLVGDETRTVVLRNTGRSGNERFVVEGGPLPAALVLASADVDGDLDPDVLLRTPDGDLGLLRNLSGSANRALSLYLGGERDGADRRTNLLGLGARVEVRAGSLMTMATYAGTGGAGGQGFAPLIFGLGRRDAVDSVRIHWPDGVVQSEQELADLRCQRIEEVQRKSSSCPVLFTWDGDRYRFITDFMGGGGLGFWVGPDRYGAPDPTEVVRIEPGALQPIEGELRLSVMEPMEEVCYVDALTLRAVDHASDEDVYPDEMFATDGHSPSGAPIVVRHSERRFPVSARGADGADVTEALASVDRRYAGPSRLDPDLVGYADPHEIVLEFDALPATGDVRLFLSGWVEYPYSRVNFAAHQGQRELAPPTFHWRRGPEQPWRLLAGGIGYPAGMPKTMVLDISSADRAGALQLRIGTSMEIYWDQVFAAPVRSPEGRAQRTVPLDSAVLRFGGYPAEYSDDGALPPIYHYAERRPHIPYKRMAGWVTREGEVRPLVEAVDDEFAILGGGDELHLTFDAAALPAPGPGQRRTFLLETHGYCKDMDPLTARRTTIDPLPFRSMESYPPPGSGPDRNDYRRSWNTRRD